jgi:hypothetical protein
MSELALDYPECRQASTAFRTDRTSILGSLVSQGALEGSGSITDTFSVWGCVTRSWANDGDLGQIYEHEHSGHFYASDAFKLEVDELSVIRQM